MPSTEGNSYGMLKVGARVLHDGTIYTVVGLEGLAVRLRSATGKTHLFAVRELVGASDFELIDEDSPADIGELGSADLDNLPLKAKRKAEELREHLNEIITGYRSGNPDKPRRSEPKPEYDPESTTLSGRLANKAVELGVSEVSLWKSKQRYESSGLYGLVDKRHIRSRTGLDRLDPRLREAILVVLDDLTYESNATYQRIIRKVKAKLDMDYGEEAVALPSRATLYRVLEQLTRGRGTFSSAKGRRSIANRPTPTYRRFKATRPGEVVLLDTTSLDVFALDPITLKWASLELTLALDLYTRSILAWRFTHRGTKGVDAALLLRDIINPTPLRDGWPDSARWPYHGIPEQIVLNAFGGDSVAGKPLVDPETVVVDHGRIYESEVFLSACKKLGISIQSARPYAPTDKAQVERMFRTIRESLLENLPGYKGPDVFSRGTAENVEGAAFYFVDEIEAIFAEWVVRYWQQRPHKGLNLPGAPNQRMSPNEMYDQGLAAAGFLFVPPTQDLYYELLPIEWRMIHHYGVEVHGLTYDGDALNEYRNQNSSYGGMRRGKWPIRYDTRDRSRVFFQNPRDGDWHELLWADAPPEITARPFSDVMVSHAKKLLLARLGEPGDGGELADVLTEMFTRVDREKTVDAAERRAIARSIADAGLLSRDRGESPIGLRYTRNEEDEAHEAEETADFWEIDPASIKAFPVYGDEDPADEPENDEEDYK